MPGVLARCLMEAFVEHPVALWSTILEFVAIAGVAICGLALNYRFLMKLREEKRNRPLGRKGNVIEPIVTTSCMFQMVYWPYNMLMHWNMCNNIIPSKYLYGWWPNIVYQIAIKASRTYISWNSAFIAGIRYFYIVHHEKANQWKFEHVGRLFCVCSFVLPVLTETIGMFTSNYLQYQKTFPEQQLVDCIANDLKVNSSMISIPYTPYILQLTKMVLPDSIIWFLFSIYLLCTVLRMFNIVDIFLYVKIFLTIKRSTERSHQIGVLTDAVYEYNKKRSIISLKMCVLLMIYELICNLFVLISPVLKYKYGWANTSFADPVSMFVILPFLHLMNDEDTKEIIYDENWLQAIKFILGIYVPSRVEPIEERPNRPNVRNEACNPRASRNNNPPSNVSRRSGQSLANTPSAQPHDSSELKRSTSLPDITSNLKSSKVIQKGLKRSDSCFNKLSEVITAQASISATPRQSDFQKVFSKHFEQRKIP